MVLVTGASGFLGGELVKQLVANGESVRVIVRKSSQISHLNSILQQLDIVEADILDVPSLEIAFEGIDKIYHSAAIIGYDESYYDSMYKTNVEGTANVVNIALDKGVKKILHVSSIAAIGGKPHEEITEETKWEKNQWTTQYGITKMLAEREIFRGISEGLEAVIVNPGIIIGVGNDEHKSLIQLFKRIANKKMPFYTNGTNGFIDIEDVAKASILLMNSDVSAERFILVNENISFKNYFEKIAKAVNVEAPKKALNNTNGNLFVFADWLSSKLTGKKRSLTKENLKVSLEEFLYSNEKIKKQLDFNFIDLDETIHKIASNLN